MSDKEEKKTIDDDLIFVDEESVKDKSKMAEISVTDDKNIKRKKNQLCAVPTKEGRGISPLLSAENIFILLGLLL